MSKVVVITAASKGIGAETAIKFGRNGYDVIINYHGDDAAAQQVCESVKATGQRAVAVKADIFTENGVNSLFQAVRDQFGSIDVLVNNAGNPDEPDFGALRFKDIVESLSANFISSVLCTQAAVPLMTKGGNVLFTSSIFGLPFLGSPGLPLYSAGKAAIISFSQTMAEKLAPDIRCNVVVPGNTKTPHWDTIAPEYAEKSLSMSLQKEWVAPEEIADAFLFICRTPHMTGQMITIDAGWQKKIRENSPDRQ